MTKLRRVLPVVAGAMWVVAVGWPAASIAEVTPGDEPQLELQNLDGEPVTLREHRGEVVLVDIWATWCRPCRRSMPFYRALYRRHRDEGLELLAVSVDEDRRAVVEFRDRHELPFSVLLDGDHDAAESFAPPGMPTSYLIDRKGVVRHRHVGFRDDDKEIIENKVLELLAEEPPDDKTEKEGER